MALSIVRRNLLTEKGYSPYCGADNCHLRWPRTQFNGEQFECKCGWQSGFDKEFINEYKNKWSSDDEKVND